jgi:effector-binding domain-containing protein
MEISVVCSARKSMGDMARRSRFVTYAISVETASPRLLAAVHRRVRPGQAATAFGPALDEVWAFLRSNPGLRGDGHNVFYDNRAGANSDGMDVHFGVEVTRRFQASGPVACIETPGGRAAVTVHRGAYSGLAAAHEALRRWFPQTGEKVGAWSLEVYGDWHKDESQIETTIMYALG